MGKLILKIFASIVVLLATSPAWAQSNGANNNNNHGTVCPRFAPGSVVLPPPDIYSQNGALNVQFNYFTRVDQDGRSLFCFQTPTGQEGPTLRVNPGDQLNILAANDVPEGTPVEQVSNSQNQCGDLEMYTSSLNIHYHGTTVSPACHQDQVIHTIINSGEQFQYNIALPELLGRPDCTGTTPTSTASPRRPCRAARPARSSSPASRISSRRSPACRSGCLMVRDQPVAGTSTPGNTCAGNNNVTPSWDLDINYVPLEFQAANCTYTPAVIEMQAGQQEFWRVANSGADSILDIQVQINGVAQPLQLVALDGVAINSQNGTQQGSTKTVTDILLAPAARAEFIVKAPRTRRECELRDAQHRYRSGRRRRSDPDHRHHQDR